MTHYNTTSFDFSSLSSNKPLQGCFDAGSLTSDAGALLLREADLRLGLLDAVNKAIADPRDPIRITHPQRDLLVQRIYGLAMGYEDLNDHTNLRNDPLWQAAADRVPNPDDPLASAPTLCRFENHVDRRDLFRLNSALVEQFVASRPLPPECLILDFDATDDLIHGNQEKRFFHGYYGGYCFLPLYVFCGDQPLVAYLRPSDGDAALHAPAILNLLVTRLRQSWPDVKIIIRADSGFCRWRMLRWCDHNNVGYLIGLARNPRLEALVLDEVEAAREAFQATGETQRRFNTISYKAGTWDRSRRVIVKAEHLESNKSNPRFVVTNLPGDPKMLYEDVYCQRGESENRIKEQQLYLFADRTSCTAFLANSFRLLLSTFAYVLIEAIRRLGLKDTDLAKAQVSTIRVRLLKLAGQVRVSVRRICVRMAEAFPLREIFNTVLARLRNAASPLSLPPEPSPSSSTS